MTIHFKSLFLASSAMLIAHMSLPVTAVICQGVFRVNYIGKLHIMIPYILLAISAPTFFVMFEAWVETL